jgi:hypothetical protein
MNRTLISRTSASAALLLAAAAYAQPTLNEDFGTLTNPTNINRAITIAPSTPLWYKLVLPAPVAAGTATDYLDIRTHNGAGTVIDTEMALYNDVGDLVSPASFDDDDGPGLGSALSYGATCSLRANDPAGAIFDGRDGGLPAGTYYIAIARYNSVGGPDNFQSPWNVTAGTGAGGPMQLDVNYGTSGPQPAPSFSAGTAAPASATAGSSVLLTATVAPCGATGLVTTIDLSSIGGSATAQMFDDGTNGDAVAGNNVWSLSYAVPGATAPGAYNLTVTGVNSDSLSGNRVIAFNVIGPPAVLVADGAGVYNEVEDNDNKPRANIINSMIAGQSIGGFTTGTSTITAGNASSDNFRVKTAAAPLGIYRHRLALSSTTNAHTGTIRGLTQTARVPNPGTDAAFQTSSTTTTNPTPARAVQWYGFGKEEEIYYRVTGVTSSTAQYIAAYSVDPVTAVDAGQIFEGSIVIDRATGNTTDSDFIVYDSNFDPVPGYSNDGANALTRTYAPGTYYVAWSNFNTGNDQGTPSDDTFQTSNVMDFPNVVANSSTTTSSNIGIRFTDVTNNPVTVALTKTGFFEVPWVRFQVVPLTQPTNPVGNGSATPATAQITTSTLLTVAVTGGLNPASTGLAVTGDLSSINGSSTQQFFDNGTNGDVTAGDNIFSYSAVLAEPLSAGAVSVPFTVTDAQARTGNGSINLTLTAAPSGGCCTAGVCSVTTAYACTTGGGTYNGNGSDCAGTPGSPFATGDALPAAIPDFNSTTQVPGVRSVTVTVPPGSGTISNLGFTLGINHTWVGDMIGTISNGTTTVTFMNRPGVPGIGVAGYSDNLAGEYRFSDLVVSSIDTGCTNVTGHNIPTGAYAPANPLAAFAGQPLEGTWTLTMSDNSCAPPCPGNECGNQDYNGDGDFGTDQDIEAFFACLGGNCCTTCFCQGSDFNGDGDFGTDQDIEAFFRVLGGGNC